MDVPNGLDMGQRQEKALQGQQEGSHHRHSLCIKMSHICLFNRKLLRMGVFFSCSFFFFILVM